MPLGTLLLTGFLMLAVAAPLVIRWFIRRYRAKRFTPGEGWRCVCGYLLVGLEIPRCPECGRMIGFNKSPEELGVSEEEMRAEAERRRITRGSANIPSGTDHDCE